jgi:AraC-like DNA-binding protein
MVAFSTEDVPEERRVELWEGHNAAALIGLRCTTLDGLPLGATELNVQMDRIRLARVTGTSHTVQRSAELIRSDPADAVALYFTLVGEAFFYCEDGVRILHPGQMLACDVDRPFLRGFSHGLQELAVVVPRRLFADITGMTAVRAPLVVDFAAGGNAHAHALATLVGRAVDPAAPVIAAEHTVLDLLEDALHADCQRRADSMPVSNGARLVPRGRPGNGPTASANLTAARIFIDRRLADHRLSATRVAAGVGVSARQLSRIFAEQGTSVPQYILGRRLALAHRMLSDAALLSLPTSEVARRCGLVSSTHFVRAFKDRYGLRPADLRAPARSDAAIDGAFPPSQADFGQVEDSPFSVEK